MEVEKVGEQDVAQVAIPDIVKQLRKTFNQGTTYPLGWRQQQLEGIVKLIEENEDQIYEALLADLGKSRHNSFVTELSLITAEAKTAISNLSKWMKPESVSVPLVHVKGMSAATIQPQPLGVVLIISPWNFPINLVLGPLIGAIAAGNCVVIKPSEVSANCSKVIADLIPKYLDPTAVTVVEGAVPETTALLREKWDYIFYTGNGVVGRIVMRAAAENLTPVTLELGGKSPCIIDKDVDLEVAARRVVWGKFNNAGQACIAPDYLLVHKDIEDQFVDLIKQKVTDFYGEDPSTSQDYGRIVHSRHVKRLANMLEDVPKESIVTGGVFDEETRYFSPTIVRGVPLDAKVMQEEIFGPILPVFPISDIDEALAIINERPKPLAIYLFSKKSQAVDKVMERTSSGGLSINDTLVHFTVPSLPFGGVGESGMGAYHDKASFDTFSHRRSVLHKTTWFDMDLRYPPYNETKEWMAKKVLG